MQREAATIIAFNLPSAQHEIYSLFYVAPPTTVELITVMWLSHCASENSDHSLYWNRKIINVAPY